MEKVYKLESIIDGRYKVIAYHGDDGVAQHYRVVDIHSTWGQVYHLLWYHLSEAQEQDFENYRQLLRLLERSGQAALERIVARPASYYAVWHLPEDGHNKKLRRVPEAILERLRDYGYAQQAFWLAPDGHNRPTLYGLAFGKSQVILPNSNKKIACLGKFALRWLPALCFASVGLALLWSSLLAYIERPSITVPDVRGQSIEEAMQQLHQLGFIVYAKPVRANEEQSFVRGEVMRSVPRAGTNLRQHATVWLRYAEATTASHQYEVPDLQGQFLASVYALDKLEQRLNQAKLRLGKVLRVPAAVAENTIVAQSPPAGTSVQPYSPVDVVLSTGLSSEQTLMPDVRGLSLSEARAWLQLAGIQQPIMTEKRLDTRVPLETVLEQNIAPNRRIVARDATVRLVLSDGGESSQPDGGVPDFTSMSLEQARDLAESKSLALSITPLSNANLPAGVVLQSPAPHQAIEHLLAGINIWVNTLPPSQVETSLPPPANPTFINPAPSNPMLSEVSKDIYIFTWRIGQLATSDAIADVTVTIPDGQRYVVYRERIQSNYVLSGSWQAPYGEALRFELSIDGQPYGDVVMIEPR